MRHIRLAVVLAALAVLTASCGAPGGPGVPSVGARHAASGPRLTAEQARLRWAQCMRAHGVNQPDPGSQGQSAGGQVITNKATYNAAQQACAHILRDAGLNTSQAPSAAQMDRLLRYARCMRAHGEQVSDPRLENGQVVFDVPKGSVNSPQYRAADQACHQLLGSGKSGGNGGPKG